MLINIALLTGESYQIQAEPNDTIASIKLKLQSDEGIPVDQQSLQFNGQELDDNSTLADNNIQANDTLSLTIRVRG